MTRSAFGSILCPSNEFVVDLESRPCLNRSLRYRASADLKRLGILALFAGLLGLRIVQPVCALEKAPKVAKPEVTDPSIMVGELARLEAQIAKETKLVTLEEAISTGIRANPQLLQAFSAIQQYEWQLIAAQRQWYPKVQLNNGTPFAGI